MSQISGNSIVQANNNEIVKAPHYCPFAVGWTTPSCNIVWHENTTTIFYECRTITWRLENVMYAIPYPILLRLHVHISSLPNRLLRPRSKKASTLRVTGLCEEKFTDDPHKGPVTRKMFPFNDVIMIQLFFKITTINDYVGQLFSSKPFVGHISFLNIQSYGAFCLTRILPVKRQSQ